MLTWSSVQVVVQGIPWKYTWRELKPLFEECGAIARADVAFGRDGRSRVSPSSEKPPLLPFTCSTCAGSECAESKGQIRFIGIAVSFSSSCQICYGTRLRGLDGLTIV